MGVDNKDKGKKKRGVGYRRHKTPTKTADGVEGDITVRIMKTNVHNKRAYVPSHDPGFSVKVATSRGLSSFNTPRRILYSPV